MMRLVTKAWESLGLLSLNLLCLGPVPERFSHVKEAVYLRVMRC